MRSRRSLQWFPFFEGLSGVGSARRNPALLRAGWGAARERWQSTADGGHGPGMCVLEAAAGSVFPPTSGRPWSTAAVGRASVVLEPRCCGKTRPSTSLLSCSLLRFHGQPVSLVLACLKYGRNHVIVASFSLIHLKRLVFQLNACWISLISLTQISLISLTLMCVQRIA